MNIALVPYTENFLELSWHWLNDPEIKKLTNTPFFSKEVQKNWFDTLEERIDYKIWGITVDNKPIGVCGLKNLTKTDCEYWGYIGEKEYWGKGIGSFVLNYLTNYVKSEKMESIWLNVVKDNSRAIWLYTRHGFKVEKDCDLDVIKMRLKL